MNKNQENLKKKLKLMKQASRDANRTSVRPNQIHKTALQKQREHDRRKKDWSNED